MNNPKAFPSIETIKDNDHVEHTGITLWDYYAAAAISNLSSIDTMTFKTIAIISAEIADSMLAEREKRGIK